jgi:uncharacterized protein (TIGR02270 family)
MHININVINQHAEDAAFQWLLRDKAVCEPHYALKDLAKLDGMVEAHIDGLRIAGDAGWDICNEHLLFEHAGEVFAASVLAFETDDKARIDKALNFGTESPELSRGVISALGWLPLEHALLYIQAFLASDDHMLQRIGIGAAAIHRHSPGNLDKFMTSGNPLVRARTFRMAGELGDTRNAGRVVQALDDPDGDCRFWAAYSGVLMGYSTCIGVLRDVAEQVGPLAERAVGLACRGMTHADALSWQKALAGNNDTRRIALKAAGAIGDAVLIPWIIEQMYNPEMARVAGEAFTSITGVDIAYQDLEGDMPRDFEAGPNDNPEDDNVAMDPDENLPWPDPSLIATWWADNQRNFKAGKRCLLGRIIASDTMQAVLREGRQRQRAAAALEMVLLSPPQPLFEVRARGDLQKNRLGSYNNQTRK